MTEAKKAAREHAKKVGGDSIRRAEDDFLAGVAWMRKKALEMVSGDITCECPPLDAPRDKADHVTGCPVAEPEPIPEQRFCIADHIVKPGDGGGRWYLYDLYDHNDGPPCAEFYERGKAMEILFLLTDGAALAEIPQEDDDGRELRTLMDNDQ